MDEIRRSLARLRAYVEREGFRGYDPYDALRSRLPLTALGKWIPILAIQLQKRSPVNLRPLLGIPRSRNPKAMGLFLHAYTLLYERERTDDLSRTAAWVFEWLCENHSRGYSGHAWGYDFDWASPAKFLPAGVPSVVVTGFVGTAIFEYHRVTGDARALEVVRSACDFILEDLPVTETPEGICISYTPLVGDCCYNASMLGAELLARVHSVTDEARLLEQAVRAVDFVVARQHPDGRWNYSLDPDTGEERAQVDFHQGFVLDSLHAFRCYSGVDEGAHAEALDRGLDFYRREQFTEEGRALWRLPKEWPADIHHQAQGILTFARASERDPAWADVGHTIARWTIANMQDPGGYFHYRKGRWLTNTIPYMRWGQAWMMLALARLLTTQDDG